MKTFNFTELTLEEANLILAGLCELPAKVSFQLINKLQNQAAQQASAEEADAANEETNNG